MSGWSWVQFPVWLSFLFNIMVVISLTASLTVNGLVTGLIVFKIFKVFREDVATLLDGKPLTGIASGRKLQSIIFIIIESGMPLFVIQLARLVMTSTKMETAAEIDVFAFIIVIHQMLNVIISSVIATLYSTDNVDLARE
jgi:hypothetical protein